MNTTVEQYTNGILTLNKLYNWAKVSILLGIHHQYIHFYFPCGLQLWFLTPFYLCDWISISFIPYNQWDRLTWIFQIHTELRTWLCRRIFVLWKWYGYLIFLKIDNSKCWPMFFYLFPHFVLNFSRCLQFYNHQQTIWVSKATYDIFVMLLKNDLK